MIKDYNIDTFEEAGIEYEQDEMPELRRECKGLHGRTAKVVLGG